MCICLIVSTQVYNYAEGFCVGKGNGKSQEYSLHEHQRRSGVSIINLDSRLMLTGFMGATYVTIRNIQALRFCDKH